jgi:hypothetical protein
MPIQPRFQIRFIPNPKLEDINWLLNGLSTLIMLHALHVVVVEHVQDNQSESRFLGRRPRRLFINKLNFC